MINTRQGFTLLELLVVISIIAILSGVMLHFVKRTRESSYVVKDLSNLRQVGTAIRNYITEEGYFPGSP